MAHRQLLSALRILLLALVNLTSAGAQPGPDAPMQRIGDRFEIDRTEVTIGQFRRFASATGSGPSRRSSEAVSVRSFTMSDVLSAKRV